MSQALTEYFVSGFTVLIPSVVKGLDISQEDVTWPASAFSLVISSFLLPFGRLADIYGSYPVHLAGNVWYCVWALITGFSQNEITLDVCRAFQGLGPAAFLPSGLMLLGSVYWYVIETNCPDCVAVLPIKHRVLMQVHSG
jgi:MFS family permease